MLNYAAHIYVDRDEIMIEFKVNSISRQVEAEPDTPLLWVVREELKLHGTKFGCGAGLCPQPAMNDKIESMTTTNETWEVFIRSSFSKERSVCSSDVLGRRVNVLAVNGLDDG